MQAEPIVACEHGTMGWLFNAYLVHLEDRVAQKVSSPLTLKERKNLARFVLEQKSEQQTSMGRVYANMKVNIPEFELEAFKDRMLSTPGKAKNVWKLLIAVFDFGMNRGHCKTNPARAVSSPIYKSKGGAIPWTIEDLEAFKKIHPQGSAAHLALTLFMFTACRISDAVLLGRANEVKKNGVLWLEWQPVKKGSKFVQIPMLEPLQVALNSRTVIGSQYLLTAHGKPFRSPEGLRNRLKKWCEEAGIDGKSSNGIRKAAGHLLALNGATQYEIMAVHGHANAATSQIYTDAVERSKLGEAAVRKLSNMKW